MSANTGPIQATGPAQGPGCWRWWGPLQVEEFLSAVDYAVWHRHGAAYDIDELAGTVTVPSLATVFDLEVAARSCSGLPAKEWADHLHDNIGLLEHKDVVDRRRAEAFSQQEVFGQLDTFESACDNLAIKVTPIVDLPAIQPVAQWLPYGLASVLVHDDDGVTTCVDRRVAARWVTGSWADAYGGGPGIGWLAALRRGRERRELAKDDQSGLDGSHMVFTGPAAEVSAHVAKLGWGFANDNPHGAVLAVPSPGTLLFLDLYPDEPGCREAVAALAAESSGRWAAAVEPVSPHLMWWAEDQPVAEFARVRDDGFILGGPTKQVKALGYRRRRQRNGLEAVAPAPAAGVEL